MQLTPEELKVKMVEYVATLNGNAATGQDASDREVGQGLFNDFMTWLTAPPPLVMPALPLSIDNGSVGGELVLAADGGSFARTTNENNARLIVAAVNAFEPDMPKRKLLPRYKHATKGGVYEMIGNATGAGTMSETGMLIVYRSTLNGQLYYRTAGDFEENMHIIAEKPAKGTKK